MLGAIIDLHRERKESVAWLAPVQLAASRFNAPPRRLGYRVDIKRSYNPQIPSIDMEQIEAEECQQDPSDRPPAPLLLRAPKSDGLRREDNKFPVNDSLINRQTPQIWL
jgi:hypothetical protein